MIRLPIQTRLANLGTKKVSLVFDKATDKHYLSEIHIPNQDGYLLNGAPGEHEHELLPAQ